MNFNNNTNNTLFNHSDIQCNRAWYPSSSGQNQMIQETRHSQQLNQYDKQKKKCRGNRKLQRYRRKLRKQGMDSQTITELINSYIDTKQSKTDGVIQQKEQTGKLSGNDSISYSSKQIKKKNKKNIYKQHTAIGRKKNKSNESVSNKIFKELTMINDSVDYTTVSDEIVSQISIIAFNEIEQIFSFLNEDEKIKSIRDYITLIDRLSYVQLQEFQWKYYHDIGMTQNIWHGRLSKYLAEKYSISHTYGRSKTLIVQRIKQIERNLQQVQTAIKHFEEEIVSKCSHDDNCFSTMKKLFAIIHQFVQEKQQPLQDKFQYKREMLILDATDHQLLQDFFALQPNKSHVRRYSII